MKNVNVFIARFFGRIGPSQIRLLLTKNRDNVILARNVAGGDLGMERKSLQRMRLRRSLRW